MRPDALTPAEREYAGWLGHVEQSVVLPLKWALCAFCIAYWMWGRGWQPPHELVFLLFFLFAAFTAGEQYFFARDRVLPSQVRPLVFSSFILDSIFVTCLVILDFIFPPLVRVAGSISEFYLIYMLLVLRGLALHRTRGEIVFSFVITSMLFLTSASFQLTALGEEHFLMATRKLTLIWAMLLLVQAFVGLVNRQKDDMLKQRERLVQSASLASIGELTAGVAHEINNPIGIIKTYADYLEQSVTADDPMLEDFETIRREAERCEQIVRRMLDFSNPRIEGFGPVDIVSLVNETVAFAFPESRNEPVDGTVEIPEAVPAINGDAVQIRQALLNVLLNARQIVLDHPERRGEGVRGSVRVVVARATGPRPPVRIRVIDNGPGITPEDARRVFEPFFTKRKKGTGLGLAITRRIIEAHSGNIDIAPHEDGGTVVTIELPIEGEEKA